MNVFGRFSLDYFNLSGKGILGALGGPGNGLLGLAGSSITHNYSLASGFTKTFSTSLLTDFRFGYFKYNPQTQKPDGGTPMTAFGIPGANTSDPKTAGLGFFNCSARIRSAARAALATTAAKAASFQALAMALGVGRCNCPLTESEQQFQFVNNWTKIRGNHQIKFGADIRYAMNLRIPSDNNRTGEYYFSPRGNIECWQRRAGPGDVPAWAMLPRSRATSTIPNLPGANNAAERQKRWFFYGQDTWRATQS